MRKNGKFIFGFMMLIMPFSCTSKHYVEPNKEDHWVDSNNVENMRNVTLIYSLPGGTRAHIIEINSQYELIYKVGTFYKKLYPQENSKVYNNNFEEVKKILSDSQKEMLKNLVLEKEKLLYDDEKIVKDSWEYYLFIDGKQIAFCRKANSENFPYELNSLLNFVFDAIGELHDIGGMS